jgi:hypothetical protein
MSRLVFWFKENVKWLWPFAGALFLAGKPVYESGHVTTPGLLAAAGLLGAAIAAYVVPNTEAGVAKYAKFVVVLLAAGVGAAQSALPGGISRNDLFTIGAALVAALGTYASRTTANKAVQASGDGRMGDTDATYGDVGDGELGLLLILCEIAVCVAGVVALIVYVRNH